MLNFNAIRTGSMRLVDAAAQVSIDDLHCLTDEMIDAMRAVLSGAQDADVTFVPVDPLADDRYAATPGELNMPWTLGHVVVHATASAEEAAAQASCLARGILVNERLRSEVSWQSVRTVAELVQRLEESRRMRHAFLHTWPDRPNLNLLFQPSLEAPGVNAVGRFLAGLVHDDSHLEQMRAVLQQAQAARTI